MSDSIENTPACRSHRASCTGARCVDRCVCFDVAFSRIKKLAENGGLPEAHRRTGCGARCGLCLPYIQLMLQTGETGFPVLWEEDFAAYGIKPGRIRQIERAFAIHRHRGAGSEADANLSVG